MADTLIKSEDKSGIYTILGTAGINQNIRKKLQEQLELEQSRRRVTGVNKSASDSAASINAMNKAEYDRLLAQKNAAMAAIGPYGTTSSGKLNAARAAISAFNSFKPVTSAPTPVFPVADNTAIAANKSKQQVRRTATRGSASTILSST